MAFVSISDFRSITGIGESAMLDADAYRFLSIASAYAMSITGRVFGSVVESITQSSSNANVVSHGHGLGESGTVYLANAGAMTGVKTFTRVDRNCLVLSNVTVSALTGTAVLCPLFQGDFQVRDSRIRVAPSPIASIKEVRLDLPWGAAEARFDDTTIIDSSRYYVVDEPNPVFTQEVELDAQISARHRVRRPGMILPQLERTRRVARVWWYAGCPLPDDLTVAVASMAKEIFVNPGEQMQSEGVDYYNYSRMSVSEAMQLPLSSIATLLRYRG